MVDLPENQVWFDVGFWVVSTTTNLVGGTENSKLYLLKCWLTLGFCSKWQAVSSRPYNRGLAIKTQFEIECRCGGHSVTKKFMTILQILVAKPKLWKNLYS